MFYLYKLIDSSGYIFYVGVTKNLKARISEHSRHKNATPAKIYKVRGSISKYGSLKYDVEEFSTKEEVLKAEEKLISRLKHQLVNKTFGTVKKEGSLRRSKGRTTQCPHCKNWYRRINAHKCKVKNGSEG